MLYTKKPFPGLLRLLESQDILIAGDSITSIFNIIAAGANTTPKTEQHPHFEAMKQCGGVIKIFELFQKNENKFTKNREALCISRLFRAKEMDKTMRKGIISHLKILAYEKDAWLCENSKSALKQLAQNAANRSEIEKDGFVIPE
ncbi:MAG: hypothetical protein EZS28_029323 [Streblomastix strix]|uniref:Uncharacterized protein n=1 Tax=Streblomastix strix TaxID=222440 RepID=A0A5J4UZ62_9EUKA|nr:MAG: hypothetical protein EZS28_029323 [Streblomastix strix]